MRSRPASHDVGRKDVRKDVDRRPLIETARGTRRAAFGASEWALVAAAAGIWGASFLLIEVGLEHFGPGLIAFGRVAIGALTLAAMPRSRRPIDRADLPRVALLGLFWMAAPLLLFPIGQQWIDSSLAGMINGAVPIFAAVTAAILLRTRPANRQLAGIAVGFVGVVGVLWPATHDADATALGASLIVLAVICYGIALNIAVPLQQRYGALPVLLRAQMVALVLLAPAALVSPARLRMGLEQRAGDRRAGILRDGVGIRGDDHPRRPGRGRSRVHRDLLHPGGGGRARRGVPRRRRRRDLARRPGARARRRVPHEPQGGTDLTRRS